MNYKNKNILSSFTKAIVLPLYVSFFIVQLFFNFDIGNHSNQAQFVFHSSAEQSHPSSSLKQNKQNDNKQTVRLNKRFQPKAIPSCNTTVIKSPVRYFQNNVFVSYPSIIIRSPFLLSRSFRGPPVVA